MAAGRILVVDDETNARKSLAIGLRLEGYEVREAPDGEAALAVLEAEGVQLAIVDLMMPGMSGLDLARRMRLHHGDVSVVLISAYHLSPRQLARADLGAIGFVPKPFDMEELLGFVAAKLEGAAEAAAAAG